MTVSTTTNRQQYATDGLTTAFAIHFPFFEDTDVNAIFVNSIGNEIPLAIDTDFTVTGGGGAGGTLTAMVAPATGGTLTIYREIPFTQEDDYVEDDPLPADTLEGGFDRAVMRDQQLQDAVGRAIKQPVTASPDSEIILPEGEADLLLGWNSSGDALENKTLPSGTAIYSAIANTRLGSSSVEAVTPEGLASTWKKGSDIASAATLAKPADANVGGYYFLTGSVTIAGIWAGVKDGEEIEFRVTGAPQFTNSATLVMRDGVNFQAGTGDVLRFRYEATGALWREVSRSRPAVSFSANKGGTNQTGVAASSGSTTITFTTEASDIGGYYDAPSSRFTPPAGTYDVRAAVYVSAGTVDGALSTLFLNKNGSSSIATGACQLAGGTAAGMVLTLSVFVEANGNDFFEVVVQLGGASTKTIDGAASRTFFQARRVA